MNGSNSMKLWSALQVSTESHTVDTEAGILGGLLVRSLGGRRELGYVWSAGSVWRWRTPSGANFGERSTLKAALEVLRDAACLPQQSPLPLILDAPRSGSVLRQERAPWVTRQRATVEPEKPVMVPPPEIRHVVWADTGDHDLTEAVSAALRPLVRR